MVLGCNILLMAIYLPTDESGNVTGSMNPGEVSIYGGGAYRFGKLFSVGLNLKLLTSHLAQYTSVGMAIQI
jgi:hypothetical protein